MVGITGVILSVSKCKSNVRFNAVGAKVDHANFWVHGSHRRKTPLFPACRPKKYIAYPDQFRSFMIPLPANTTGGPLGLVEPSAIHVPLREVLRLETQEIHERMHRHRGFAAVQNATIDRTSYSLLLRRLHGFYVPFEIAAAIIPNRSRWLKNDLLALKVPANALADIPLCPDIPHFATPAQKLGALYVVEGSTLGGRALCGKLDGLLGHGGTAGRSFFSGFGAQTGFLWREYLDQLAGVPMEHDARAPVISAAMTTFGIFETWLAGWETRQNE